MLLANQFQSLKKWRKKSIVINNSTTNGSSDLTDKIGNIEVPSKFNLVLSNKNDFSIELVNTLNEKVVVSYSLVEWKIIYSGK